MCFARNAIRQKLARGSQSRGARAAVLRGKLPPGKASQNHECRRQAEPALNQNIKAPPVAGAGRGSKLCAGEIKIDALKCKHCGSMIGGDDFGCKSSAPVLQKQCGPIVTVAEKELWLAIALCVFFGQFGAHSYYLEDSARGKKPLIICLIALVTVPLLGLISMLVMFVLWCMAMVDLWTLAEKVEMYNSRLVTKYGQK